jgi:DNA-directed RNA polymerase specialized sigma subunit
MSVAVVLTREHMGWVAAVRWKHYRHVDMDLGDELVGAGMIGLVQAARSFNADSGATFATWAFFRIHGARRKNWPCA